MSKGNYRPFARSKSNIYLGIFYFALILLISASIAVTISYFTANTKGSGSLSFASLDINLLDGSNATLTDTNFKSSCINTKLIPGATVDMRSIKVSNPATSDADVYCLVKLDIDITKSDDSTLNITHWYNLSAQSIDISDLENNTIEASYLTTDSTDTIDLQYTFDGNTFDNSYKNATASFKLGVYAVQSLNIPNNDPTYITAGRYATYLIISQLTWTT